jgi:hypothetical protein
MAASIPARCRAGCFAAAAPPLALIEFGFPLPGPLQDQRRRDHQSDMTTSYPRHQRHDVLCLIAEILSTSTISNRVSSNASLSIFDRRFTQVFCISLYPVSAGVASRKPRID